MTDIDSQTRRFTSAASDLAILLTEQLEAEDPGLHAKVQQAIAAGERLLICMEFNPDAPCVRLITLDDYERVKRVMTVPGKPGWGLN